MTRIRDVQMHAVIYEPNATGGPGNPALELDGDMLNITWQAALNFPAQCAFSLTRFNPKLAALDFMIDHIKVFREDSRGTKNVFSGKIIKPQEGTRDSIIFAWDYTSFLQRSRSGFRVMYPEKFIDEIVSAEWTLDVFYPLDLF